MATTNDDTSGKHVLPAEQAFTLYQEGREALKSGDRQLGIEKLKRAAGLWPHFKTYEILGEALLEEGHAVDAIVFLSAAVGLDEKQHRGRFLLARALIALGPEWIPTAAANLRQALLLNPTYRAARELLDTLLRDHPSAELE